jgi:hypothetical protein
MKLGNLQRKKKFGKDYILWEFRPHILTDFLFLIHYLQEFYTRVKKKYEVLVFKYYIKICKLQ